MVDVHSDLEDRARLAGFLCGLGIFVAYVAVSLLSWETSVGRTTSALSLGNLGLDHVFLPSSLHVGILAVPPLLVTTVGIYWTGAPASLALGDVLSFLQYEIVFPLFFAALVAFCLGVVSFVVELSPTVGGIVSLIVVGLFSAVSNFAFFLYLELFVVPGAIVGTSTYVVGRLT